MLKPINPSRLSDYVLWFNDPIVRKWLSPTTPSRKSDIKNWLKSVTDNESNCYYSVFEEGKSVGHVSLQNIDTVRRVAEVGIVIGEKYAWNRGYGKKALLEVINIAEDKYSLERLLARISESNKNSIKLFENIGFISDGVVSKVGGVLFKHFVLQLNKINN